MRIIIAASGRMRAGPERDLYEAYARRLPWKVTLKEIEPKKRGSLPPQKLREETSSLLLSAAQDAERSILLDESGQALSSQEFASRLGAWRDEGVADIAFLIGGAEGVTKELCRNASLVLSLGRITWPHMLVRALLMEQLYRAYSILSGHPYHRE